MANRKKGKRRSFVRKRRFCYFCDNPDEIIDYKNLQLLKRYISDRGKITARRLNGNCAKHQRMIAKEIKRARFLALAPYKVDIYR